jgi:AcrR family transcriptional regulator
VQSPVRRARGRPRSEQAEQAIIQATLDLLARGETISRMSMEAVAGLAGVGKATIYRRWPNKEALVIDALATLKEPLPDQPGRSVRDTLVLHVDRIRRRNSTLEGRIYSTIVAELKRHPELLRRYDERVVEPRREMVREALRRGVASGELKADLDIEVALYLVVGPMLFLTMTMEEGKLPAGLAAQMVDAALDGLRVH